MLRIPSRARVALMRLMMVVCSPTSVSRSRWGRLASSSAEVGTATILQCSRSPAQLQPRNARFKPLGVEPVGLGTSVLARYRNACGMNDVDLDCARSQPTREPEAVPARFEGDGNAVDLVSCLLRLRSPSLEQLQGVRSHRPRASSMVGAPRRV